MEKRRQRPEGPMNWSEMNRDTNFPMVIVVKYEEDGENRSSSYRVEYGYKKINQWKETIDNSDDYENSCGLRNTHSFVPAMPENVSYIIRYLELGFRVDELTESELIEFSGLNNLYKDRIISL